MNFDKAKLFKNLFLLKKNKQPLLKTDKMTSKARKKPNTQRQIKETR